MQQAIQFNACILLKVETNFLTPAVKDALLSTMKKRIINLI
jgi:hypothetical protein